MNTLKGWITPTLLVMAVAFSASTIRAGIIVGNYSPSTANTKCENADWGIIVTNLTGIIVGNFTGIIIINTSDSPTKKCPAPDQS